MLGKQFSIIWVCVLTLIVIASISLSIQSLPYLAFERNIDFLKTKDLIYHIDWWRWSFYIHVFSSPILLFAGLIQFIRPILKKLPGLHHLSGYIYIVVVLLISAPSGVVLGLYANGGYPSQISFTILGILWFGFTLIALLKIKSKDFESHANWMLRSFALALSAITLRFYLLLFDVFNANIGPTESYVLVSYLSWIPNLLLAELFIKFGFIRRLIN